MQVLDKYFEAIGGADSAWRPSKRLVGKGTYSGYDTDNQKVPIDIYAKAPAQ